MRKPASNFAPLALGMLMIWSTTAAHADDSNEAAAENPPTQAAEETQTAAPQESQTAAPQESQTAAPQESQTTPTESSSAADVAVTPPKSPPAQEKQPESDARTNPSTTPVDLAHVIPGGIMIMLGGGFTTHEGELNDYIEMGSEQALTLYYPLTTWSQNFQPRIGVAYRHTGFFNKMPAPDLLAKNATARQTQDDWDLILGVGNLIMEGLTAQVEAALSWQQRAFTIKENGSFRGDDYLAGNGMGGLIRIAASSPFNMAGIGFHGRIRADYSGGKKLVLSRTKYDGAGIDINPPQATLGVDIGYQF
jgi:hypothetical protein